MGNSNSKQHPSRQQSLEDLSVEQVSTYVTNLGDKYASYSASIASNAVDGDLLMDLQDSQEFTEMLQCLEITNFLHQKKLTKEWRKAKECRPELGLTSLNSSATMTDASEITMDTALSTKLVDDSTHSNSSASNRGLTFTLAHQQTIQRLQLTKDLTAASDELEPYRHAAQQAIARLQAGVGSVSLLDVDLPVGTDQKGIHNLATVLQGKASEEATCMRWHADDPTDHEICRRFILGSKEDFHMEDVPRAASQALGMTEPAKYYGHVLKYGSLRVGVVCCIIEDTPDSNTTPARKKEILSFLVKLVKGHLEKREALLQRSQNLKNDLANIAKSGMDPVLAHPVGPLRAVTASQVAQRQTLFPYPQEQHQGKLAPNGYPTQPNYTRRSASLPVFENNQATPQERLHLSTDYFDQDPAFANQQLDRTPIGKRDMERVALLQSLQLLQMEPLSPEAKTIHSLAELAGQLLQAEWVFVNLVSQHHSNIFFSQFPQGPWPQCQQSLQDNYKSVQRDPTTGETFHYRGPRATTLCNYPVAMNSNKQCFVVHNVQQDESLAKYYPIGFYSGAPIVLRGHAVGSLCCIHSQPNPKFGKVQELQQEQFAQLIAQQYETWALNRQVREMEHDRNLFLSLQQQQQVATTRATKSAPEDYAALVVMSVQGIEALRNKQAQANEKEETTTEDAVGEGLALQYRIVQYNMAEYGGFQVSGDDRQEDGAFQVAFADVVDAVQFCLRTQEALQEAAWEVDLRKLTDSNTSAGAAFSGLRVKMALHCGPVEATKDQGQVSYAGETVHIVQNLESMAHGGQILITSDIWNVASHLVQSALGSPQVIDLGSHVLPSHSSHMRDGVTTKSVLQLVPASLAHDYLQSRLFNEEGSVVTEQGRTFPRIKTKKSVSASFHEAPFEGSTVALVHIDTSHVETMVADSGLLLAALSKRISALLQEEQSSGYQSKDFLVAFEESSEAVRFGLSIQENLNKVNVLDLSLQGRVSIGVHEGIFETMGPNPINGRAEYFGEVVDRVALVANAATLGGVYVGKVAEDMDEFSMQPITNGFMLNFAGRTFLEAVQEEFSLYKAQPCKSWYDQMVDNRNGRSSLQTPWRGGYY